MQDTVPMDFTVNLSIDAGFAENLDTGNIIVARPLETVKTNTGIKGKVKSREVTDQRKIMTEGTVTRIMGRNIAIK